MRFKIGDRVRAVTERYQITKESVKWEGIVTETKEEGFSAKTTSIDYDRLDLGPFKPPKEVLVEEVYEDLVYEHFELVRLDVEVTPVKYLVRIIDKGGVNVFEKASLKEVEELVAERVQNSPLSQTQIVVYKVDSRHELTVMPMISGLPQQKEQKKKDASGETLLEKLGFGKNSK